MHTFILIGCPFIAVDKSSFKEYIDVLGEWVTSDCPNGYLYSAKQCKCVLQGKKIKIKICRYTKKYLDTT